MFYRPEMQRKDEADLLDEIHYLTRLIQSHQGHGSSAKKYTSVSSTSSHKKNFNKQPTQKVRPGRYSFQTFSQHPKKNLHKQLNVLGTAKIKSPSLHSSVDSSAEFSTAQQHIMATGSRKSVPINVSSFTSNPAVSNSKPSHVQNSPHSVRIESHNIKKSSRSVSKMQVPKGTTPRRVGSNLSLKKSRRKHLPTRSQLTWKRKSLDGSSSSQPVTSATRSSKAVPSAAKGTLHSVKKEPHPRIAHTIAKTTAASDVSVYKWRRLSSDSSSRSKFPLTPQSKYRTFRSSISRKYSYIRHSPQVKIHQRRKVHSNVHERHYRRKEAVKSHSSRRSRNRVWIAGNNLNSAATNSSKDVQCSLSSPFRGLLAAGRETKTRQGNRQWMSNRQLQLAQQSLRSAAVLSSARKASLVSLERGKYVLDSSKRRLKKVASPVAVPLRRTPTAVTYRVSMEASVKRILANRAIEKSRRYVWHARKRSDGKSNKYCMFFNKFGKCNKGDKCTFIHDPDRIAICRKYLKGLCEKTDGSCLLSHKISKEKMPVCSFFLRGVCVRESCPYLHVSVGKHADICMDFVKGYCPKGEKCTKKHVLDCPEFLSGCKCPRGNACPLRHPNRVVKSDSVSSQPSGSVTVKQPRAFGRLQRKLQHSAQPYDLKEGCNQEHYNPNELNFIPLESNSAPDFIAL